jgi:hypothetical protein
VTITELMGELESILAAEGNLDVLVADNEGEEGEPILALQRDGAKRWVIL